MNRMQTAGLALLIASVGGNVVLARAVARGGSAAAPAPGAAAKASPPAQGTHASAPQVVACGSGIDVLQAEVAEKSAALRGLMPAELLFAGGQPNPAAERLMAPLVSEALGALGPTAREQHLRCRDVACQVVFRESAALDGGAWESALARHAGFRAWASEYGLSEARPLDDAETKVPLVERTIYFKLRPTPSEGADGASEVRLRAAEAAQKVMAAQPSSFIHRPSGHPGGKDARARR